MPDDIYRDSVQIPAPSSRAPISTSYRPRPVGGGLSRPVLLAAAGLGGLLVLGMGGWAVMGRRPATVPVIEADARPLRVKPENAGGLQVAGADEAVMGGTSSGADRMAPAAEVPAPQALRAQMQQPPAAPAAAPPAAAATEPPPGPQAQPSASIPGPGASPLPDTPARPQPAAPVAAPAAAKPVPPAKPAGTAQVQLAALESDAAARAEWARLAKRLPELLNGHQLVVQKAERDGQPVFRVRTGGFADPAEASAFCGKVRAKGASCTVASF